MDNNVNLDDLSKLSSIIDLIYQGIVDPRAWERVIPLINDWLGICSYNNSGSASNSATIGLPTNLNQLPYFNPQTALTPFAITEIGDFLNRIALTTNTSTLSAESVFRLDLLLPHFAYARAIKLKISEIEIDTLIKLTALENQLNPILLVDADGEIVLANSSADRLLAQNDGLHLDDGLPDSYKPALIAYYPEMQVALNKAIQKVLNSGSTPVSGNRAVLSITRPSGKPELILEISALRSENDFAIIRKLPHVVIVINDSSKPVSLNFTLLKSVFGLTDAECRVAELLMDRDVTEEMAEKLNISINTIKTHIQRIYQKTDTNNRGKLTKRLLALVVP